MKKQNLLFQFSNSIVVNMYSFYPPELLTEISIDDDKETISNMLLIANNINYYSREETEHGDNFEYALEEAFNLFADVEARRIAGAGNVDVECIYLSESGNKKFDIEAKSTKSKLVQINPRRLNTHRGKIGSRYSIVVAPNYSIGVLTDIKNDESVIVKAASLSNYMYQYIAKRGRNISYEYLENLILDTLQSNKAKDITDRLDAFVYSNFGHVANDLSVKKKTKSKTLEYDAFVNNDNNLSNVAEEKN